MRLAFLRSILAGLSGLMCTAAFASHLDPVTSPQLPIATSAAIGAVKNDGITSTISGTGVLSITSTNISNALGAAPLLVTGGTVSAPILFKDGGGQTLPAGAVSEVGATVLDFGVNQSQVGTVSTSARGGLLRVDTRTTSPLFNLIGNVAGGTPATLMSVDPTAGIVEAVPTTFLRQTNGGTPTFTQLDGAGISPALTVSNAVQGSSASPVSGMGYKTPMTYLERWDNSSGTTATADWGNARLAPMLLITGIVGPANVNNMNGIAVQLEADYADTAGVNYPATGVSILNQCNPGSGNKCRDSDNLNLVNSWVSGTAPINMVAAEVDNIPLVSATLTHPGAGGSNFSGFWFQAAGNSTYSSAGVYCSNSTSTNGWNWCMLAEGNFADYGAYINNTLNQTQGKGLYVNTAFAGAAGVVASFGANATPYLTISGSGVVNLTGTLSQGGKPALVADTTYTHIDDITGSGALLLGNGASYYNQTTHIFRTANGGTTLFTIAGAGVSSAAGFTAPTYTVGSTAGVSCSAAPTASFATMYGLVTHC